MTVRPGDIIHGDINGLVQVPNERLDELRANIAKVREDEQGLMERVRAGGFTLDDLCTILLGNK